MSATASARNSGEEPFLHWSRTWSLTARILAVNLFALLMLAGGVLYLDSFRERLLDQRTQQVLTVAELLSSALGEAFAAASDDDVAQLAARATNITEARIRVYGADGDLLLDSWTLTSPTFRLRDPDAEPFRKDVARLLDRMIEGAVGAEQYEYLQLPKIDQRSSWPEAVAAEATGAPAYRSRFAPDRTVIVSAAAPMPGGRVLMLTSDARDVTTVVRAERFTLFMIFLGVLALSLLLSSFLARTIVRPIRRLAIAAQRVRLGRAREVTVPRFVRRRDEIGELARTISDMTAALRHRIDATEAFAADVAHEIKNPLASLRSAVEGLERIEDPTLRAQLLDIVKGDVVRIDRLISDISDASRLDAELSRARFEPVDLGALVAALVGLYDQQQLPRGVQIAYARPQFGTACVRGDENRLAQVARNLIDNAISFSPDGGIVRVSVSAAGARVVMRVDDEGPGVPETSGEKIFHRFYSERPGAEVFGKHSGLGLAIAKAIVEAHDGTIGFENLKAGGRVRGARFSVGFPVCR